MSKGKKKSLKNDMRYVAYLVSMYLRGKSELEEFREDLNQEGMMALLLGRDAYDPTYGMDRDLYLAYRVKQGIQNYINRKELRHFSGPKPTEDELTGDTMESNPYWDLGPTERLEDLVDTNSTTIGADKLCHFTDNIEMTDREQEALDLYLTVGSYVDVGDTMGISKQRVEQLISSVIMKCRELEED